MTRAEKYLKTLHGVNISYLLFAIASAATGLWFFIRLNSLVSLRDYNHFRLDFRVYWPQIAPWFFIIVAVLIVTAVTIGWIAVKRENVVLLKTYGILVLVIIALQIFFACLIYVFVNGSGTDVFIADTIIDAFERMKEDPYDTEVIDGFATIEKEFQCCGAHNAFDYKPFRDTLPFSCCENRFSQQIQRCDYINYDASGRFGCIPVVSFHVKLVNSVLAGVSLLLAVVGIVGLVATLKLGRIYKKEHTSDKYYMPARTEEPTETDF